MLRHSGLHLLISTLALVTLATCGTDGPLSPDAPPTRSDATESTNGLATTAGLKGGVPKVTICHIPPGNPDNAHAITIGEPALGAHIAHGDSLGECASEPPSECRGRCSTLDEDCCALREDQCSWFFDPFTEKEFCAAS